MTKIGRKKLRSFFDLPNSKHNKRFLSICTLFVILLAGRDAPKSGMQALRTPNKQERSHETNHSVSRAKILLFSELCKSDGDKKRFTAIFLWHATGLCCVYTWLILFHIHTKTKGCPTYVKQPLASKQQQFFFIP
ncbi:MAG: hypothetical protein ACI30J_04380 [Paludibacteraceae bacterium]